MPAFGEAHGLARARRLRARVLRAADRSSAASGSARAPAARRLGRALRPLARRRCSRVRSCRRSRPRRCPSCARCMLLAGMPIAPAFAASYGLVGELAPARHDDRGVRLAEYGDRGRGSLSGPRSAARPSSNLGLTGALALAAPCAGIAALVAFARPCVARHSRSGTVTPMPSGSAPYRRHRRERQGRRLDRRRCSRAGRPADPVRARRVARPRAAGRRGGRGRLHDRAGSVRAALAPAIGSSWSACTRRSRRASPLTARSSPLPRMSASGSLAYLSIVKPSPTSAFHHGRSHYATEQMILASGLPYAFLRMNLFLDDLPLWFDPDGVCRGPGGDGRVSLISREDTAAVSAGVLVGPGYEGEALDLTGEESHTLGELAALCSDVLDRPLRYTPGTREAWIESRLAAGVAAWDANIGVGSYDALLGRRVRHDVRRRAARDRQAGGVARGHGSRPIPRASRARRPRAACPGLRLRRRRRPAQARARREREGRRARRSAPARDRRPHRRPLHRRRDAGRRAGGDRSRQRPRTCGVGRRHGRVVP